MSKLAKQVESGFGDGNGNGNGNKGGSDAESGDSGENCYAFLAKDARWKVTEDYVTKNGGFDAIEEATIAAAFKDWDDQVSFEVFGNQDDSQEVNGADTESPDGLNEIMYGNIAEENVIAVALVWGIFGGPPFARELVEHDITFDNVDFEFGDAEADSSLMDFPSITKHEFGHSVGLADLYQDECAEQTMYGYADEGETNKRDLEAGDKKGIQELYL